MSGAVDTLDRRDAVDMTAAAIMVGLTLSWGLNYVA
ncbi:EamA/RhaT family transporter, partial [Mesorhizobium sp. M3A.F.Ca.ET.201.01.1.1]